MRTAFLLAAVIAVMAGCGTAEEEGRAPGAGAAATASPSRSGPPEAVTRGTFAATNALLVTGLDERQVLAAVEPLSGRIAEVRQVAGATVHVIVFSGADGIDDLRALREKLASAGVTAEYLPAETVDG